MAIDLGGGVVATHGDEIVASALWWPYGETHATLGLIIVLPAWQGGGLGRRLTQALIEQSAGRSQLLNATAAGEPLYAKLGFMPCGGVRQYQGDVAVAPVPVLGAAQTLRSATAADLPLMLALDRSATGLSRHHLIAALLGAGGGVMLERAGEPVGYSILRAFGRGHVIGPVVAPDQAAARALIGHWLHERGGSFLRVDVLIEAALDDWLIGHGMRFAGGVATMVRGEKPAPTGPARLYALSNQAFG